MPTGMSELLQTVAPVRWDKLGDGPVTGFPDALEERTARSAKRLRNKGPAAPGNIIKPPAPAAKVTEHLTPPPAPGAVAGGVPGKSKADYNPAGEYQQLLKAVTKAGTKADADPYQKLMRKERRVLDTVDRIVNDRRQQAVAASSLAGLTVSQHAARFVAVMRGLLDDLTAARTVHDVLRAVTREDRQLYLGVALIMTAVLGMLILHV